MTEGWENIKEEDRHRVNQILEVILSYAKQDFSLKTTISDKRDALDAIGAGVNMLGEELETSTVSLREKERLLKEIHHRVKNNLQIVSSLLNLQSGNVVDKTFQDLLNASRNRINSIALVHEMLYASGDLKSIEVGEYLLRLSQNVFNSMREPNADIHLVFNASDKTYYDVDRVIPLGLIINELITNSLKHAFPTATGIINIDMQKQQHNLIIRFTDSGVGFPANFDPHNSRGLGMQLVHMLSDQIGARLEISGKKGTSYTFCLSPNE